MMDSWVAYLLLVPAGFVAGLVNTIAGGGSFVTLPALMLCGLSAPVANGTNRIAILLQTGTATAAFYRRGRTDLRTSLSVLPVTAVGAVIGGLVATRLPADLFRQVFGGVILVMVVVFALKPRLLLAVDRTPVESRLARWALFFGIGVYGGFIQAGVGLFLILGIAVFLGRDLIATNGVKNALVFLYTIPALLVFVIHDQVQWLPGLLLAAGNVAGAQVGVRLALKRGVKLVYGFVLAVMIVTGIYLLLDLSLQ